MFRYIAAIMEQERSGAQRRSLAVSVGFAMETAELYATLPIWAARIPVSINRVFFSATSNAHRATPATSISSRLRYRCACERLANNFVTATH